MQVPIALRYMLPVGVKGMFCLIMVLTLMSGDASHILTWGGIFIQDIVLPLRKTPMTPRQHVLVLRLAVIGVAVFAFIFSILFHQKQDIVMWWLVTEGVFLCGGGAAIIGGLYWKKGTTAAAWAALITGSGITLGSILIGRLPPALSKYFNFNGNEARFIAAGVAAAVYIVVSLLTCRENFDMDRMLHRGRYALADDAAGAAEVAAHAPPQAQLVPPPGLRRRLHLLGQDRLRRDILLVDVLAGRGPHRDDLESHPPLAHPRLGDLLVCRGDHFAADRGDGNARLVRHRRVGRSAQLLRPPGFHEARRPRRRQRR